MIFYFYKINKEKAHKMGLRKCGSLDEKFSLKRVFKKNRTHHSVSNLGISSHPKYILNEK